MAVLTGIILALILLTIIIGAVHIAFILIIGTIIWLLWCAIVDKVADWWKNCD